MSNLRASVRVNYEKKEKNDAFLPDGFLGRGFGGQYAYGALRGFGEQKRC